MNNLENIFKNKLENLEVQPETNLWGGIETKLNKLKTIKTVSIVSVLVAIFISTIILVSPTKNIENTITQPNNTDSEIINNREIIVEKENNLTLIKEETTDFVQNNSTQTFVISGTSSNLHLSVNQSDTVVAIVDNTNKIYEGFELSTNKGCSPLLIVVKNQEPNYDDISWTINNVEYNNLEEISVLIEEPGDYEIVLSRDDNGMTNTYKDVVTVEETPIADFSAPNSLFERKTVLFENLSQDAENFLWLVNDLNVSNEKNLLYSFNNAGRYKITLIVENDLKCSDTTTKYLLVKKPAENIVFPTALVPDKYGSKGGYYSTTSEEVDIFYPVTFKDVKEYQLTIFDKFGKLIFESNDINKGWDGYFQEKLVPIGVFVYKANVTFTDGEKVQKQGSVTVIYDK